MVRVLLIGVCLVCGCKSGQQRPPTPPPVYMPQGQMQRQMQQEPAVFVRGEVRNPVIPWTEDLTLARAILAADYVGRWDPHSFNLIRGNRTKRFSAAMLLSGEDAPLEPGDVIEVRR